MKSEKKIRIVKAVSTIVLLIIVFIILKLFNITYWSWGWGLLYIIFYSIFSISIALLLE